MDRPTPAATDHRSADRRATEHRSTAHRPPYPGLGVATYERILRKSALTPELRRILDEDDADARDRGGDGDRA
jgi:hypothetical protein